jgi:hypothetical protein
MANVYLISGGGNWSNGAVWNTGTVPTAADDVFSNNFTVNVDVSFTVLSLRSTAASPIVAGGSFVFNTAGVTGTVTSSSPLVPGATNMVQITATTGTVTLSLGGSVAPRNTANDVLIFHSGNCNFTMPGGNNINGIQSGNANTTSCINKTSAGTITITGNLNGGAIGTGGTGNNRALLSTSGNTVVIGNVVGGSGAFSGNRAIEQSAGTLTVTGNVTGGQGASSNQGILFSGTSLTVTGTILGGTAAGGISTSAPLNNIIGNVTAGTIHAIASASANQIQVTGTVTASASSQAITMTNANGQVYLNGNMVNNNGKMAIFAPVVWLDKNNTTSAAFFTSGGVARTLYSADTVPNQPAQNNVRFNTVYGPGNSLTGTCVMPVAANSRNGVVYDNGTVGTALFTTSLFLTELSSSTVPVAVRMQNLCTPMILGELMEAFKK